MPLYRNETYLGEGAFGSVWACSEVDDFDVVVQDELAIKYLRDKWLGIEPVRERFRREARFLRSLKHPNILPVIYSNLSADRPYIVTPLADTSLAAEIADNHASDRDWALNVFREVLAGVAHAHGQDVMHRDLKPDNVLFVDGVAVVSDFGLGKDLDPNASAESLTADNPIGTPLYMAPEMWSDAHHATKAADVYSLGRMLWELVTNRPLRPVDVDLEAVDDEPLREYIARCCDQEPTLRFRDASEALRAWEGLVGGLGPARSPFDRAEQLVNQWRGLPSGDDIKALRRLDDLLSRHHEEEQLYYDLIPYLPDGLVEQYAEVLPGAFSTLIHRYADHISGQLPWEYCDDAADFYAVAFGASDDPELRHFILIELFDLGQRHNRYPVAGTVRKLLWSIDDEPTAQLTARAIRESPAAGWYDHWLLHQRKLMPAIREAFKTPSGISASSEDDIPF